MQSARRFALVALAMVVAACAVRAPEPTLTMAGGNSAVLADLRAGYDLYRGKCSGCHALPIVNEHDPNAWEHEVDEMVRLKKVRLAPGERELLLGYLTRSGN